MPTMRRTPPGCAELDRQIVAGIQENPWLSLGPGLAIFITVLGVNLFGDGLRDALDPRLKYAR